MKALSSKLLLSTLALAVSSAWAAEPDAAPATAGDGMERVYVTAQKRVQTTIDVAQSMSVVSGAALEQQQANGFADYLKLIPGVQLDQSTPGAGRLVMRGINTGSVASTVAVYADETPFGSSSGLVNGGVLAGDFDTFDMARIEVLRGPQGALYGASSLGGLLKFVTNLPNKERFEMRARAGAAQVDGGGTEYKTNLMLNTPISDTLAFRASGSYTRQPGFIDSIGSGGSDFTQDINKVHSSSGRASLLYTPTEALSLRLSANAQNIFTNAPSVVEADPDTLQPLYGRQSLSQFVPPERNVKYRVYNATLNWDLGPATLTSSTSFSKQNQTIRDDATNNLSGLIQKFFGVENQIYLGQNTNLSKKTQELRLASNPGAAFDWLGGVYYTHEDGLVHQTYVAVTPRTLSPISSLPNLALLDLNSTYRETAAFGNVTAHIGPQVDIDVGGRYSQNKQVANQVSSGALAGDSNNVASSSENVRTYSVAPKYKLSENAAIYARLATGYRPGGPNVLPASAPAGTPKTYNSDTVRSYELGYKAYSADGKFSFEGAVYHVDWKNIQLFTVVNGFGVNANGVGATSDGVELSASFQPVRGLHLSANGAYTRARLDGDTGDLVGGMAGDRLPFTPKFSFGLNGDYRWQLEQGQAAYAGASLRHLSKQSGDFDATYRAANGRQRELEAYTVLDVHAGLERGKWTFDAYVKNLNNSEGKTSTSALTANGANIYPNGAIGLGVIAPRTVGFSVARGF
jgi:outer membrane receptor protein involved in Fe transport